MRTWFLSPTNVCALRERERERDFQVSNISIKKILIPLHCERHNDQNNSIPKNSLSLQLNLKIETWLTSYALMHSKAAIIRTRI